MSLNWLRLFRRPSAHKLREVEAFRTMQRIQCDPVQNALGDQCR
jgi:hypothetical protein